MKLYSVILTPTHSNKYLIDKMSLSKFYFSNWHHVSIHKEILFSHICFDIIQHGEIFCFSMLKKVQQLLYCGFLKIHIFNCNGIKKIFKSKQK